MPRLNSNPRVECGGNPALIREGRVSSLSQTFRFAVLGTPDRSRPHRSATIIACEDASGCDDPYKARPSYHHAMRGRADSSTIGCDALPTRRLFSPNAGIGSYRPWPRIDPALAIALSFLRSATRAFCRIEYTIPGNRVCEKLHSSFEQSLSDCLSDKDSAGVGALVGSTNNNYLVGTSI
jgi:hypothetical protein